MPVAERMTYYVRERIGPKQSILANGDLLCEDVPIYRTGRMLYGYGEVFGEDGSPLEADLGGITYVDRAAEDVFRQEVLSSFEIAPLVNTHPDEDVTPYNWRRLACGTVTNVRRGSGIYDDVALATIRISNKDEIEAVRQGLREVSCGYTAKYEKTGPATYRQHEIVGNHVALVEAGRCGSRCSIGDRKTVLTEDCAMSWKDKIKAAFASKDESAFDAALAEAPKGETIQLTTDQLRTLNRLTRDAAHEEGCDCAECKEKKTKDRTMDARMKKVEDAVDSIGKDVKSMKDAWEKEEEEEKKKKKEEEEKTKDNTAIEGSLEMEAPPGTGDRAFFKTVKDSASAKLDEPWQEAVSLAEVIAPGHTFTLGTFDAAAKPRATLDKLGAFRKNVLGVAYLDANTHMFMDSLTAGRDFKTFDCDRTRDLFRAVGQYKRAENNRKQQTSDASPLVSSGSGLGSTLTPDSINKRNAEFWVKQTA